jgi:extracellular elastinolytic metalloproteinase
MGSGFRAIVRIGLAVVLVALAVPAVAAASDAVSPSLNDKASFFDSNATPAARKALADRAQQLQGNPSQAVQDLRSALGTQGIVQIDPLTGTPREVARNDGFLTAASAAPSAAIALDYVRAHQSVFGVDAQTLAGFKLRDDYVSIDGTHHLSFVQVSPSGIPVFGNGIRAHVAKDGQLIAVQGSPLSSTPSTSASPTLGAGEAIAAAKANADQEVVPLRLYALPGQASTQAVKDASGTQASLVYYQTVGGVRLAWQTQIFDSRGTAYTSVVDAANGRVLYRRSLVNNANASIWTNYPGAAVGGTQQTVNITGWLTPGATTLTGPNTHVYSDVNDDNAANAGEDIPSSDASGNFNYAFQVFGTPPFGNTINSDCTALFPCSWDSSFPTGAATFPGQTARGSWRVNRAQNGAQVFYFINNFPDHLAAAPIGFTPAAGNFQGNDPVLGEPDDGAATISGIFPDPLHTDNANMATPPDGISPRMQMYLFNDPAADDPVLGGTPRADPFIQSNGGDEADVVYHEYTHGLSNRLVVDAGGNSTLGNVQAGSMGEAWSDWYAMDFLVNLGQFVDTQADGDLRVGEYVGAGRDLIRTQPMDCPVGSTSSKCHGTTGAGPGGYTYGDFGKIIGRAEVHADGEIWGETLWDLRSAIGSNQAENLVTRAMELAPSNPSYLDMRNSIVQADLVDNGGALRNTIWSVFAHRGMGYFAAAIDGDDSRPVEDFAMPPTGTPRGNLGGQVRDFDTHKPLAGITVAFGGHNSGFPGDLADVTAGASGQYLIHNIFAGTYHDVFAKGPGFDPDVQTVTISGNKTIANFTVRRDWASILGGASIANFNGPDFTGFGCGPSGAIDQSEGNGWGSTTDGNNGAATGNVTPKFIVVRLPNPVNITEIQVNPSNTCGDGGSASTRGFRIETSTDGTTFSQVATGVFYAGNRGRENTVALSGPLTGIRFVKFWMLNPQVPTAPTVNGVLPACTGPADCGTDPNSNPGVALHCTPPNAEAFSGCQFMDMVELKVYGRP